MPHEEVTRKETPLPIFALCSKMDSHFAARDCHNAGLQSIHHDLLRSQRGKRIKKTTWESLTSFLSLEANHWCGLQKLGVLLSPILDFLCSMKLHLMTESFVTTLYRFHQWVPSQCKDVLFQHAFRSPCI